MAGVLNTLAARVILIGLAIHAVLLPLLFFGLLHIVEQSHEERFINDARKYSRFLADFFQLQGALSSEQDTERLLDSAVLGSGGVYAELIEGNTRIRSELLSGDSEILYRDDFAFGEHGDHIYFLSIPLDIPGRQIMLRMGFDEQPTIEQIRFAAYELTTVLSLYLIVSVVALVLLSTRMTQPLRALQRASRNIAKGQHSSRLQVDTPITEIAGLASDLESMRAELVGVNASLRQQIAEREMANQRRETLESKLRQAQKLETVGVLAGGIAHEFNNVLLPIYLYTEEALHDLPPDSPVRTHLERVLKSANRAKTLVQQILTFSHQNEKQAFTPVDLRPVAEEALELLRALLPPTVELHLDLAADACMVMADRNQIHQLIMNLCSNAYQALDETGGSIRVTLDRCVIDGNSSVDLPRLPMGRYIRIRVSDTGHGIDRSSLHRIFEPFYTTRAVGQGTGLGLSVVHGIAVSHSGDITVESAPETGTTFQVYLPEIGQNFQAALDHDHEPPETR